MASDTILMVLIISTFAVMVYALTNPVDADDYEEE
jgi:uncharacterized membrane protein